MGPEGSIRSSTVTAENRPKSRYSIARSDGLAVADSSGSDAQRDGDRPFVDGAGLVDCIN